jgi:hypothetical protein
VSEAIKIKLENKMLRNLMLELAAYDEKLNNKALKVKFKTILYKSKSSMVRI